MSPLRSLGMYVCVCVCVCVGLHSFYWCQIFALESIVVKTQNVFRLHGGIIIYLCMHASSQRNNLIKLTYYYTTLKRVQDSQIVRANKNSQVGHGWPHKRRPTSGNNQQIKALYQGCHWVWGLILSRAIKEKPIAINRDWVCNRACRLSNDRHIESYFLLRLIIFS